MSIINRYKKINAFNYVALIVPIGILISFVNFRLISNIRWVLVAIFFVWTFIVLEDIFSLRDTFIVRWLMKKIFNSITPDLVIHCILAVVTIAVITVPLKLIGRDTLGEAVIALLYLLPVGWSTTRWGQAAGICAALTASLTFDFFFIPPFNTFTVGNLEGWLVLAIFLIVAILFVGRIQTGLSRAKASEREAIFMYEMSVALAGLRSQEAVIHALAHQIQQMFHASLVQITVQYGDQSPSTNYRTPGDSTEKGKPDLVVPVLASPGLIGEIRLWRGNGWLPLEESRLLKNIATQAELALERARLAETETKALVFSHLNM